MVIEDGRGALWGMAGGAMGEGWGALWRRAGVPFDERPGGPYE
jgi:hypothetical protein